MFYLLKCFIQMKKLLNNNDLNEALYNVSNLGFVPTMGSLHKGHISLIKKSKNQCSKTLVSIYVNPTQFNNKNDYKNYPRNSKKDLSILKKMKVNFVYLPKTQDIYGLKSKAKIKLNKKEKIMCAKFRKGHFEGVIDVMDRLTKIIKPKKIFMGEKDYQQLYFVKKNIEKKYQTEIIGCKTIRNKQKLALSSRNILLNKSQIIKAEKFTQKIIAFKKKIKTIKVTPQIIDKKKRELSKLFKIKVQYFELRNIINFKISNKIKNSKIFVAFFIDKVRLIDNF
ncbi:pantoate--beta-alanine ligase [Pelagibacterales bacterium SAG-MED39]|nr:pantoate--beta-alanine ligase [Pelagibacterales bacterium SAG-MED39]